VAWGFLPDFGTDECDRRAKKRKVVWYATLNISDSNALLRRFEQKYPFIETELLPRGANNFSTGFSEDSANP
jgi:hypothetical protein